MYFSCNKNLEKSTTIYTTEFACLRARTHARTQMINSTPSKTKINPPSYPSSISISHQLMFKTRLFFRPWLKRTYATYKRFDNTTSSFTTSYAHILTSRKTLYVGGGLLGFYIYNLHAAPFTGRRRFIWVPYWLENKIGDYSYYQIYNQYKLMILPHSNPLYTRVSNIMNKLLSVALTDNINDDISQRFLKHLKSLNWEINIIQNNNLPPNAFILPNGKIFIFSSILPICENDDGLATVLAHELSHQLAQHSSEQLLKQPIYLVLSTILYSITGISWFNDLLINGVLTMPASREMESEADHIGCELLAKACFHPEQAINFWQRMSQAEKRLTGRTVAGMESIQTWEFFSTHPATSKRIADIQKWMPHLLQIRESSGCYEYGKFYNFNQSYFKRF